MVFVVVEALFLINEIMHFHKFFCLFIYAKYTLTLKHFLLSRNLKVDHLQNHKHYTENEWPNFDEYIIAMKENEWEEDDVRVFAMLIEQSKRAWKLTKEELETINVSTR